MIPRNQFDSAEGIEANVWSALQEAVNKNNKDLVYAFVGFFRKVCRNAVGNNSIVHFRTYISLPYRLYSLIFFKSVGDSKYNNLVTTISEQLSLHLKEVICFDIAIVAKRSENDKDLNLFCYEAFLSFNRLFYLASRNQDWAIFKGLLKRFTQLPESLVENRGSQNSTASYSVFKRHVLVGLKSWLYLLYINNKLPLAVFIELMPDLNSRLYQPDVELRDLMYFRGDELGYYLDWENWDFMDRQEGKSYSPPMASNWLTEGFLLDRIRTNNFYFQIDSIQLVDFQNIPFFYEAAKTFFKSIENNNERWLELFNMSDAATLNQRIENLLLAIARIARRTDDFKDKIIAESPLSESKIKEFTERLAQAWKSQTRVRRIFDYFHNKVDVTGQDILLKRVGTSNFLEKGKVSFIDGDYHQFIYGMEEFGGFVGQAEDSLFFDVVNSAKIEVINAKSIVEVIKLAISHLKGGEIKPTAIILETEYIYLDSGLTNDPKFSSDYDPKLNPYGVSYFVIGTYDGIPLFTTFNASIRGRVIVADFFNAFQMKYKTNDEWHDGEFAVSVEAIKEEEAKRRLETEPKKWLFTNEGIELSEAAALASVRTSVVLEVETIIDFQVKDQTKVIIGVIKSS